MTSSIDTSIQVVRKGGTVTLIGNLSKTVEMPLQQIITRELKLLGSCAISGEYPLVLDLIARKKIAIGKLLTGTGSLGDGQAWFERLYAKESGQLKVVLHP